LKNNTDVMQKFASLSKEELIKKLNLAMDAAFAIDGMWFLNVEKLLGFEKTNDVNLKVWEHYPKVLHRRMTRYYELKNTGLEGLKEMLELDPMLDNNIESRFEELEQMWPERSQGMNS